MSWASQRTARYEEGESRRLSGELLERVVPGKVRLVTATDLAVADAEVVQRHGQVGEEGRVGGREVAVEADRFFSRRHRLVTATDLAVAAAEVVQRHGQVGEEGRVGGREVAAEADRFFSGRHRLVTAT